MNQGFAMVSVSTPYKGFDTLTPSPLAGCSKGVSSCQARTLTPSDTLTPSGAGRAELSTPRAVWKTES